MNHYTIETGRLIVEPRPEKIDATSLDLHLGNFADARIWDIDQFADILNAHGKARPELHIGQYRFGKFATKYTKPPPDYNHDSEYLVMRRGAEIIVRPLGFLLWPTREKVGTPEKNADLICFVDGKSTKARAGMVVHLITSPPDKAVEGTSVTYGQTNIYGRNEAAS